MPQPPPVPPSRQYPHGSTPHTHACSRPAFRLLAIGMGVWTLAVAACAAAPNFPCMLLARAAVGVGEASFVALAAPFIGARMGRVRGMEERESGREPPAAPAYARSLGCFCIPADVG